MTPDVFDKGMNLLENNLWQGCKVEYPQDVRLVLWEWIKNKLPMLKNESFERATVILTGCTYAPRIDDLKGELVAQHERALRSAPKKAVCGTCWREFDQNESEIEDSPVCNDCLAKNASPERRRQLISWREKTLMEMKEKERQLKKEGRI